MKHLTANALFCAGVSLSCRRPDSPGERPLPITDAQATIGAESQTGAEASVGARLRTLTELEAHVSGSNTIIARGELAVARQARLTLGPWDHDVCMQLVASTDTHDVSVRLSTTERDGGIGETLPGAWPVGTVTVIRERGPFCVVRGRSLAVDATGNGLLRCVAFEGH